MPTDFSSFLRGWLTVAIFGALGLLLAGLLLGLSSLIRPKRPSAEKAIPYESGVDPVGDGWSQSQIRYYIFALLFVMFDSGALAFLILFNVPFAAIGGILALPCFGLNLSVSSLVGFIALFGIAIQNGVILIERIRELQREGRPLRDG